MGGPRGGEDDAVHGPVRGVNAGAGGNSDGKIAVGYQCGAEFRR